jgi:hypothetical protein
MPLSPGDVALSIAFNQPRDMVVCEVCHAVVPKAEMREHKNWHERLQKAVGEPF